MCEPENFNWQQGSLAALRDFRKKLRARISEKAAFKHEHFKTD
jgi:hypothetical protein